MLSVSSSPVVRPRRSDITPFASFISHTHSSCWRSNVVIIEGKQPLSVAAGRLAKTQVTFLDLFASFSFDFSSNWCDVTNCETGGLNRFRYQSHLQQETGIQLFFFSFLLFFHKNPPFFSNTLNLPLTLLSIIYKRSGDNRCSLYKSHCLLVFLSLPCMTRYHRRRWQSYRSPNPRWTQSMPRKTTEPR